MSDWSSDEGRHWADNAERYRRMLAPFIDVLVGAAEPRSGDRVLDVGCGNGDLSAALATAVGLTGAVVGVDLSPAMVAVAKEQCERPGLAPVTFEIGDAATYTSHEGFDLIASRFGVMFFDEPGRAFGHLRSLLRPSGRVVFACWQPLLDNEWMTVPGAAVAQVLPLPSGDGGPGPFSLADPAQVDGLLVGAGFSDVSVKPVSAPMWMGHDAMDAVEFMTQTGMGRALFAAADSGLRAEAVDAAVESLRPHESADGVLLNGAAWLVTASNGSR